MSVAESNTRRPDAAEASIHHRRRAARVPGRQGTLGPDVIDIGALYQDTGHFTYDPGFTSTASCESKITFIDGDKGVLLYRGYPIDQLAGQSNFARDLLSAALRRAAHERAISGVPPSRRESHHGERADDAVLYGLPPRCASYGGHARRGGRVVGVLSRLHGYQRSPSSARLQASA